MVHTFYSPNHPPPIGGEVNDEPSMTVPDQTMSMRELLTRFANGLPIDGDNSEAFYDDDENSLGINLRTLDLVDQQNLREYAENLIEAERQKREAEKNAAAEADALAKATAQVQDAQIITEIPNGDNVAH